MVGLLVMLVGAMALLAACSDSDNSSADTTTTASAASVTSTAATSVSGASATSTAAATTPALSGNITVFAASSLTEAFQELGKQFETDHPGTKVTFNFGGSSALATQINEGAPADVFASADPAQMKAVTDKGSADAPVNFATNVPVVVVPKGDNTVMSFEGLATPGVKLVLAAPEVPIGNYARQILTNASGADGISITFSDDVLKNLQSNEANVRAVLAKIQVGEADAGIVYQTDAATVKDEVTTLTIPEKYNVTATYPVTSMTTSSHHDVAAAFIQYLTSDAGEAIMAQYGFGGPAK